MAATRQQLTDRANQAQVCFVLHEYSDDPDTSAYMVGQNVPLRTEATEQTPFDSDSFRRRRHQEHSHLQRS